MCNMTQKEIQFCAALLDVGNIEHLTTELGKFNMGGGYGPKSRISYATFREHKGRLILHLVRADYFGVHRYVPNSVGDILTADAALWVGEFYQWLAKQQSI